MFASRTLQEIVRLFAGGNLNTTGGTDQTLDVCRLSRQ